MGAHPFVRGEGGAVQRPSQLIQIKLRSVFVRPSRDHVLGKDMEKNIIERAYEIAPTCGRIEEVRAALRREGYSNVDAHLAGRVIRADLTKLFNSA